jgi:hypothetical protein
MVDGENNPAVRWEQSVSAELLEHIRDLRTQFASAFCQAVTDTIDASAVSLHGPISQTHLTLAGFDIGELKKQLPAESLRQFDDWTARNEPSAIFAAYFELLCGCASCKAVAFFRQLLDIEERPADMTAGGWSAWAEEQAKFLISSHQQAFALWVIDLCEQGEAYSTDDSSAYQPILGRDWLAPRFLVMDPSPTANEFFDGKQAWARLDFKSSQEELKRLAVRFAQRVYKPVRQAAIDYRAERATGAKPSGETEPATTEKASKPQKSGNGGKTITYTRRHKIIFGAIQAAKKGRAYCKEVDDKKLTIPEEWIAKGCPATYALANGKTEWRQKLQEEKARYNAQYKSLSDRLRENIIQGIFD